MRIHLLALLGATLVALPASAETVELVNGDRLSGEIIERTEHRIVLQHELLGRVEIPAEQVKPLTPVAPEKTGLLGTAFMEGWTREIGLGLNGSEGNTVNFNLRTTLDLALENERRRWKISGRYIYKTDDGDETDSNGRFETSHVWLFSTTDWFAFSQGVYDYDKFKAWKSRVTATAGPGYEFVASDRTKLRGAFGVSGQREFSGEKNTNFGGYLAAELEGKLNSIMSLDLKNQIFPYVAPDFGEFRNLSNVDLKIQLTDSPNLNLKIGLENEYESNAVPEDDKNDLTYHTTIGLEF
jgi:putative salt-induced outer membrane protein YdiY